MAEQENKQLPQSLHEAAEKSPKIKQMFEAVTALLREGADINTLKVSDITTKASIGKGTAYEYFKSKEDLIVQAVLYEMETMLQDVDARMEKCNNFKEKYSCILDWLESNFSQHNSITLFINMYQGSCQISESLKTEMRSKVHGFECVLAHSRATLEEGIQEGILRSDLPMSIMTSCFIASFAAMLLFMGQEQQKKETSKVASQQMKQLLIDGLLQTIGV